MSRPRYDREHLAEMFPPVKDAALPVESDGTKSPTSGRRVLPAEINGDRHYTLYQWMTSEKRRGIPIDAVLAAAQVINLQRCKPPLPWSDAEAGGDESLEAYLRRTWNGVREYDDRIDHQKRVAAEEQKERARREARRKLDAEEQPPLPPLEALTLAELFAQPQPSYLIDQWIPTLGLIQVVAPPGSLKSFLMCHVGLSIAAGERDFFNYPVMRHGPVLYIAAEGAGAFQFRIRAWCQEHGFDAPDEIPFRVIAKPVNLRDPNFQMQLRVIVANEHPLLIIVDTLSRCMPGADENSNKEMGEAVSFCSELQQTAQCAIALVHHPTKKDPTGGGRGAGNIFGAIDSEIRLEAAEVGEQGQDAPRPVIVRCTKQKDDAEPPPLNVVGHVVTVRNEHGRPLAYESGRNVTSLVLRADTQTDEDRAHKVSQATRATDLKVLAAMPNATSLKTLRELVGMKQADVSDAAARILVAGWASSGKRGEPYTITEAGRNELQLGLSPQPAPGLWVDVERGAPSQL